MSDRANVQSIEVIADFRAAAVRFDEDASAALCAMQQELSRVVEYFEQDRPRFWKREAHRAYERVAEARTSLETCRMKKVAGRTPACDDEKLALRKAKARLEYCEQKTGVVKKWADKVRRECGEFSGRTGNLQRVLEGELPRMQALLERTTTILEEYATTTSGGPSSPPAETTETSSSEES